MDTDVPYSESELKALASGVTPEQLAYRRIVYEKQRKAWEAHAHDTLWTPIYPRGIVTIPRSLPIAVRHLVSLILLLVYPIWLFVFLTVLIVGRIIYALLWVLFLPLALRQKRHHPAEYAAAKEAGKHIKLDFVLSRLNDPRDIPPGVGGRDTAVGGTGLGEDLDHLATSGLHPRSNS
jgi:hypothetical protein